MSKITLFGFEHYESTPYFLKVGILHPVGSIQNGATKEQISRHRPAVRLIILIAVALFALFQLIVAYVIAAAAITTGQNYGVSRLGVDMFLPAVLVLLLVLILVRSACSFVPPLAFLIKTFRAPHHG